MDIDDFKDTNDNYGHIVGDEVIKSIAMLLRDFIRKEDSLFRWGGDEFAAVLNCSLEDTLIIIERVRTRT